MPWYIPILIFIARLLDVTIGTIRIIFVIRGAPRTAAILGFFEVTIWILGVAGTLSYLFENIFALLSYSGGFAMGNLIGIYIERKLALGKIAVRVINSRKDVRLPPLLREAGFGVTELEAYGKDGPVELCYLVIQRAQMPEVEALILRNAPTAFITIENVRQSFGGLQSRLPSERFGWLKLSKYK